MTDLERFNRLACLPNVKNEYTHTKNTQEIDLRYSGQIIASKLRIFRYGICQEEHFYIRKKGVELSND